MRIDLTHVAYDAQHACFRADAILHHGSHHRAISCAWHGPRDASFPEISVGLSNEARRARK